MLISFNGIVFWYHHHHHVVPLAWISLTLSRHFSLSFITSGRSSGLYPVSSLSCCMYVRAGRPAFAWPYAGVRLSAIYIYIYIYICVCVCVCVCVCGPFFIIFMFCFLSFFKFIFKELNV